MHVTSAKCWEMSTSTWQSVLVAFIIGWELDWNNSASPWCNTYHNTLVTIFFFLFDTYTNTRFVFVYLAEEFNGTVAKSVAFPNLELTSVKQILQVVEFLSGSLKPKCLEFTSSATFVNTCFRIPETRVLIGCWKTL